MNLPSQIAENHILIGKNKASLTVIKMFVLAVLAGIFLALAAVAAATASATIDNPSVARLISACIFPAGLVMISLAGSELFTGNCLMVISLFEKAISIKQLLKCWIIVYIGNLIGAALVALCVTYSHILGNFSLQLAECTVSAAVAKVNLSFTDSFLRGILCNILVCLGVWMANSSKTISGKIIAMYFPIVVFVLGGFEHCIANMYYIPAGIFASAEYNIFAQGLDCTGFFINNLLPVTLGNIVGGSFVVGLGYWFVYIYNAEK